MSFDLTVLAATPDASDEDVRAQALRCRQLDHVEGDLDPRIVAFYEDLRAVFPDSGPASGSDDAPWASTPIDVGIDHVLMCLRYGHVGDVVVGLVLELAALHELVIYNPQGDEITSGGG
ncbi:hypothetical protein [Promicromonospora sukumoe]|uniref:hypothetical protein n=1 Tax=Promicromonospora sukumoe TaxID=88382 RepID=UPI003659E0A0